MTHVLNESSTPRHCITMLSKIFHQTSCDISYCVYSQTMDLKDSWPIVIDFFTRSRTCPCFLVSCPQIMMRALPRSIQIKTFRNITYDLDECIQIQSIISFILILRKSWDLRSEIQNSNLTKRNDLSPGCNNFGTCYII